MRSILIILSVVFTCSTVFSQNEDWLTYPVTKETKQTQGKVVYKEDPRTQKLIDHLSIPQPPEYKVVIDGYRVQIYFSNDRTQIDRQRDIFQRSFPDTETYVQYEAPNYSIKAGNFRTELEAEKLRSQIIAEFPASIIQKSKIELPKIKEPVELDDEQEK